MQHALHRTTSPPRFQCPRHNTPAQAITYRREANKKGYPRGSSRPVQHPLWPGERNRDGRIGRQVALALSAAESSRRTRNSNTGVADRAIRNRIAWPPSKAPASRIGHRRQGQHKHPHYPYYRQ
ncbi:hypothetical protein [Lysobacter gummosus]|uniref:hypothetical protein n=1 Tax=Lysobacter gummosus TaxID=262324 RepID=UPI0036319C10